mmetsp:Transcript_14930/g.37714  ORF Transcript_14930/g.37714 Transcript_14930/m.37714 type:complete len:202 (+) Transcript_14930:1019-1624(+)
MCGCCDWALLPGWRLRLLVEALHEAFLTVFGAHFAANLKLACVCVCVWWPRRACLDAPDWFRRVRVNGIKLNSAMVEYTYKSSWPRSQPRPRRQWFKFQCFAAALGYNWLVAAQVKTVCVGSASTRLICSVAQTSLERSNTEALDSLENSRWERTVITSKRWWSVPNLPHSWPGSGCSRTRRFGTGATRRPCRAPRSRMWC